MYLETPARLSWSCRFWNAPRMGLLDQLPPVKLGRQQLLVQPLRQRRAWTCLERWVGHLPLVLLGLSLLEPFSCHHLPHQLRRRPTSCHLTLALPAFSSQPPLPPSQLYLFFSVPVWPVLSFLLPLRVLWSSLPPALLCGWLVQRIPKLGTLWKDSQRPSWVPPGCSDASPLRSEHVVLKAASETFSDTPSWLGSKLKILLVMNAAVVSADTCVDDSDGNGNSGYEWHVLIPFRREFLSERSDRQYWTLNTQHPTRPLIAWQGTHPRWHCENSALNPAFGNSPDLQGWCSGSP